jgi:cob(I)alamin adenosyltransferase
MRNKKSKVKIPKSQKKIGLILVFTGDGKGKTTTALGITLRAVGHNMKVCFIEFMKGTMYSGEIDGLKRLSPNIEIHITGKGFLRKGKNSPSFKHHRLKAQAALKLAQEKISSGDFDVVILDEINNALSVELLDLPQVLQIIDSKPSSMHLILTGRDAHPEVIKRAHTVTEMKESKHAYRQRIGPQKGIDY